MPFEPAAVIARRSNTDHLKYRVRVDKGTARLYIAVRKELSDLVNPRPKAWRLDIDLAAGRGRLTGLIQDDGGPATRRGTGRNGSDATCLMSWALADKVMARFGKPSGFAALENHTITSMGIEFDLPAKADGKAGK
jgi:hypothetical protein